MYKPSIALLWILIGIPLMAMSQTHADYEATRVDPIWPFPDEGATITIAESKVKAGDVVTGEVILTNLTQFQDEKMPIDLPPFIIRLDLDDSSMVRFQDGGGSFLEHAIARSSITANGTYRFTFRLIGTTTGVIRLPRLRWKWPILTEGCCSTALLAILAGCKNDPPCICDVLKDMPAPGKWCCKLHPLVFRYYWTFYKCSGASPY